MDDYLQTFKEITMVQNSSNFVQGIGRLPAHRLRQEIFLTSTYTIKFEKNHYLAQTETVIRHFLFGCIPRLQKNQSRFLQQNIIQVRS